MLILMHNSGLSKKMATAVMLSFILKVTCLTLAFGDELPGHMQPLGSHRPMEGEIERLSYIPDPVTFYQEYVKPKRPVVFSAAIANTAPLTRWTDEYFKSVVGDEVVGVEKMKKEIRGGPGGEMPFAEFLEIYQTESVYVVHDLPGVLKNELFFPGCLACGGFLDNIATLYMWFSSGGTKSVLHTDSLENMHCVVAGQKEFVMIPPQYTRVIGPEWANQGYYNLDVEQVNMTAYPRMAGVPWYKTVLQQGDCLYLPYLWIHHVYSTGRNLGINLWWVQFKFNPEDCPEGRKHEPLVSLKEAEVKSFLQIKSLFYDQEREDGYTYVEDVLERLKKNPDSSGIMMTREMVVELFNMISPGSNERIATSDVLSAADDVIQAASEFVLKIEEEYYEKKFAKEEMEGGGFPPEFADDQSSQDIGDLEKEWREAHNQHHQDL